MPDPSPAELRGMLVDTAFRSDAFTVAKGEKTPWMLEVEAEKIAAAAQTRQAQGLPPSGPKTFPAPDPATLPVLSKLAGVLKYFIKDDQTLAADTKIRFKAHFAGVLTQGQLVLEPACDPTWDAATPADVTFSELRKLGMHRGGEPVGIDSLGKWVKSRTFGACMPTGEIADNFLVLVKLLTLDPELVGGKLEWNEMDCCITVNRVRVEDNLTTGDIRIRMGEVYFVPIQGKRGLRSFVPSDVYVQQALENIARKNRYHEAREYMDKLPAWDGVDRFETILKAIGGHREVKGTPAEQEWIEKTNALALSQFKKTCIGTVARTYHPGCQMDTMLVLKSKQGTKKSSLFRALAPANRFSDAHIDFGNKDSMMAMQQNTWYECAELSGMLKRDVQVIKAFITTRSDDFRLPYGKAMTKNPRHCVLVGTTNDDTPLKDATGSRRFWVIVVDDQQKTDIPFINSIKDQIWAQSKAIYFGAETCPACAAAEDGEVRCPDHRWWLSYAEDQLREEFNEQFTETEPYVAWLQDWLRNTVSDKNAVKQGMHAAHKNTDALKIHELLEAAGLPSEKCHDPGHQRRMAYALKQCGYVKRHTEAGNVWISPGMQTRPHLTIAPSPVNKPDTKKQDDDQKMVGGLEPAK